MKKSIAAIIAVTILTVGSIGVYAAELTYTGYENVPAEKQALLDERIAIVDGAVEDGKLTEEQGSTLIQHVIDMFTTTDRGLIGSGRGREEGFVPGSGNEDCVLGEDGQLGLFRNEEAGQGRMGSGAGMGRGNRGASRGQGNMGVCVIE